MERPRNPPRPVLLALTRAEAETVASLLRAAGGGRPDLVALAQLIEDELSAK